ncbi:MAG: GatB/YqeY domain-containing protein [Parcubacteria group bacterium]|nr:GatB/YqeY domain-containing protein [Parcubacteria group bacterium]
MTLHEQIQRDVKEALKARDEARLRAARNLLAALTNELVAKRQKPNEILSDENTLAVVKRLAKQRRESIELYEKGGRPELAAAERAELGYLEGFLPELMSEDEIRAVVMSKKAELNITDAAGVGRLTGAVMQALKGRADGARVKAIVEELLR